MNVRAVDEYGLIAVVVTIAGSGTAAVGVTALVSVSFNTITTVIGETNTIVGKSFTLLASSNRDVVSTVATVAGSGVAGVGVSLSVVVSGNKMSQDAHDSLYQDDGSQLTITRDGTLYLVYDHAYEASGETVHVTVYEAPDGKLYRMDSNGNLVSYTVDKAKLTKATASNLDPQAQLDGAFKLGHSSARANKPGESLNDLLAGDGQRGARRITTAMDRIPPAKSTSFRTANIFPLRTKNMNRSTTASSVTCITADQAIRKDQQERKRKHSSAAVKSGGQTRPTAASLIPLRKALATVPQRSTGLRILPPLR